MRREFTGTVYIVEGERVLLLLHRKQEKWMPPGGHVDDNELPHECARREAWEETGLEIEFILQENMWVQYEHAQSLPRPYMCLLEEIPAKGHIEAHQHVDMIFVARPLGGNQSQNLNESTDMRWFTAEEIAALTRYKVIYPEVQDTALLLLGMSNTSRRFIFNS